jgi:hypothetical protein
MPGRRIAVEIKSFVGPSVVDDIEKALGQYLIYHSIPLISPFISL